MAQFLDYHGIELNPIYHHAMRVGCWCCPLKTRPDEVLNFCRQYPALAQRAAELEVEIGHTWKNGTSIGNLLRQARSQLPLWATCH